MYELQGDEKDLNTPVTEKNDSMDLAKLGTGTEIAETATKGDTFISKVESYESDGRASTVEAKIPDLTEPNFIFPTLVTTWIELLFIRKKKMHDPKLLEAFDQRLLQAALYFDRGCAPVESSVLCEASNSNLKKPPAMATDILAFALKPTPGMVTDVPAFASKPTPAMATDIPAFASKPTPAMAPDVPAYASKPTAAMATDIAAFATKPTPGVARFLMNTFDTQQDFGKERSVNDGDRKVRNRMLH